MNYEDYVVSTQRFSRPSELHNLRGCPDKLKSKMEYTLKYDLTELINDMVTEMKKNYE